jgi:hypothetical protein
VNENPQKFISGLAVNIGINAEKAATMVIAAVAARTRAGFLQAWVIISCIIFVIFLANSKHVLCYLECKSKHAK